MTDEKPMNQYRMSSSGLEPLTAKNDRDLHRPSRKLGLNDKKKVAALAALLVLGCGVVAFQFLRGGSPKPAGAVVSGAFSPQPSSSLGEIESVLKQLETRAPGQDDVSVTRVEELVKEFHGYVRRRQVPLQDLGVNPFLVVMAQEERVAEVEQAAEEAKQAAEEALKRQQIREAAAQLTLTSIVVAGEKRLARVSGEVCGVGDKVRGFQVERIEPDRVVLVCEGETVELTLFEKPNVRN